MGETSSRNAWLEEKISNWKAGIQELAQVAGSHPQSAAGLQKSLQQEWAYVQRVTEGIDFFFSPLEEEIANGFLPSLFGESLIDDSYSTANLSQPSQ